MIADRSTVAPVFSSPAERTGDNKVVLASTERARVAGSRLAMAAGIMGFVVDAVYLGIIFDQGDLEAGRVTVVSVSSLR